MMFRSQMFSWKNVIGTTSSPSPATEPPSGLFTPPARTCDIRKTVNAVMTDTNLIAGNYFSLYLKNKDDPASLRLSSKPSDNSLPVFSTLSIVS